MADNDSDTHSYRDVKTMAYGPVLIVEWWLTALEVKLHLAHGLTNTTNAVKAGA